MASSVDSSPTPRRSPRRDPLTAVKVDAPPDGEERGAVLFMVALLMFIFMLVGGLALDLSSKATRGQELQNAADAAALAGAQVFGADLTAGDQALAQAQVNRVLAQNGIGADVDVAVTFGAVGEVSVALTDGSSNGLLSSFTGGLTEVNRVASAEHLGCSQGCSQLVIAPPVFRAIEARGFGDGFLPVPVGDRLYAVNHHQNGIACVDKITQEKCWEHDQVAFNGGLRAQFNVHPYVIGSRIYYLGHQGPFANPSNNAWSGRDLHLSCFDTSTNTLCLTDARIFGEGWGALAGVGNQMFVFTGAGKVHCFNANFSTCGGYAGGLDTSAALAHVDGALDQDETNFTRAEVRVFGDRIYYSFAYESNTIVQCWNASTASPCADFGLIETGEHFSQLNRGLVNRSATGTPTDFCLIGRGQSRVMCWDLFGGLPDVVAEANLEPLRANMLPTWRGWNGLSSYHAGTNRVFSVTARNSNTYCYDFTTATTCGSSFDATGLGLIQTYGYVEDSPSCLIGLGDQAIFFSMKPDLSGPCDSAGGSAIVSPCTCLGQPVWPEVEVVEATGVVEFNVRVLAPDGSVVVPWTDLLIDDIVLSGNDPHLEVEFDIIIDTAADPFLAGTPPAFQIVGEEAPRLTD